MNDKERLIIQKLIGYSRDIAQYTAGLDFEGFTIDKKTVSACAFTIGQMGELAGLISEETREAYDNIPWKAIRGMRNRIVHNYESVDLTVMWSTVNNSIPEFEKKLVAILSEQSQMEFDLEDEDDEYELGD
ncbi:MAG: DUF86 domain-containing protein [Oscillospiraceae bacterium]|jgi:uncharacterized protein with HEPN domain|nr:DUF86 domain-containing protein [Oscillospiraceae bacterium]